MDPHWNTDPPTVCSCAFPAGAALESRWAGQATSLWRRCWEFGGESEALCWDPQITECWQNSSHVQQCSQMCNSPLTSEFLMLYSNLTKQTWLSSLSGTGNSPEDPVKSPGLVTVNCKLLPCTNARTLAMTHNRRLSFNLPGIFCSKLIKRNCA